ncbi:type III-B CRISPR module-associated protein Cmr5 [Arachnia propionica]|nr:type III-B CRISPR module-associated protein Cmr5 [Arachnia propionica]
MIETLSQQRVRLAHDLVSSRLGRDEATVYGRLCHRFPMMVMQGGLITATLFIDSKSTGKDARAKAHQAILSDLARVLGLGDADVVGTLTRQQDALTLMAWTHEVLHTWAMMRRFAVSILKVESGGEDDGEAV